MSSPNNGSGGWDYSPFLSQPSKDTAINNLRAAYPRGSYPFLTSDWAWAMLRGSPGFDPEDARDQAYVRCHWQM
jgi:hypothetical protein